MRPHIDPQKIEQLMDALGKASNGSGAIYFTGGASALLIGWRSSTVDVDIRLDPEPPGIFQAIAKIKRELNINIELASPQDFLPPLPGWRDRSMYIGKKGQISFYHYDFTAQALSKLSRGYGRDIDDVMAMYEQKLFSLEDLIRSYEAIEPELIRFPTLEPADIKRKIQHFVNRIEQTEENPNSRFEALPGADIILPGIEDLRQGRSQTVGALLIAIAATRLSDAGLVFSQDNLATEPELTLYEQLEAERDDAYSFYNALLNSLNSFCNALESLQ